MQFSEQLGQLCRSKQKVFYFQGPKWAVKCWEQSMHLLQSSSAALLVHLIQGSRCHLNCRYSKLVSPALDQKEADNFLVRGIVQN